MDRLFLWDDAPGSHVEPIAEQGLTPEEVESAFDNIKTRVATLARAWADCEVRLKSHGLATVATRWHRLASISLVNTNRSMTWRPTHVWHTLATRFPS